MEYKHKEQELTEKQEFIPMIDYSKMLPDLLSGNELIDSLKVIPEYDRVLSETHRH